MPDPPPFPEGSQQVGDLTAHIDLDDTLVVSGRRPPLDPSPAPRNTEG